MLEIIKRLFKKKEPTTQEEIVSNYPSGEMSISWNGETGDFCVKMDVKEDNQDSAETLGLLLFHLDNGDLTETLIKSVTYWAEDSEGSTFAKKVLSSWYVAEEQMRVAIKEVASGEDILAIDPSEVFNLKQGLKQE
jgi:hypothetical protein